MTTFVIYAPEGRNLDLEKLSPADFELIISLRGNIHRGDGTLLCRVPGGNNGEMFVRRIRDGIYRAVHFPGGAHGPHPISLETDEHRRQKEYWARAAEDNGYTAGLEVRVKGAGVLDVTISGGDVLTDIEVQHSEIPDTQVRARTTRYYRAGYLPVWFNDQGQRPRWLYEVPALGCNRLPWDVLPSRRRVTATGLGVLRIVRCDISVPQFDGKCPDSGGPLCGRWHPLVTAGRIGLTVDDVAGMLPAGQLVPLRYYTDTTFLVSSEDMARYQAATGGLGAWHPDDRRWAGERVYRQQPEMCLNPVHDLGNHISEGSIPTRSTVFEPVPRGRRHRTDGLICPGCNESRLTFGRQLCQTCRALGRQPH